MGQWLNNHSIVANDWLTLSLMHAHTIHILDVAIQNITDIYNHHCLSTQKLQDKQSKESIELTNFGRGKHIYCLEVSGERVYNMTLWFMGRQ